MNTPPRRPSRLSLFFAEMKRRHVVRFALGYAAAAFVILQLAEIVFPAFGIGETGLRILVVAVGLLFPPALVLAWIFDVTTEGIERTPDQPDARRGRILPGLALLGLTTAVVGALAAWLATEGVLGRSDPGATQHGPDRGAPALVAYDPGTPIRSLAVLPLDDFSGDGEADYFTLGMQEELIAQLSQLPGLRVVSRTSVQRYAGTETTISRIGRDLQVDAVIEGSVRRSDDQVRITVQLIHAASDTHIWTQQYDRPLENVLALQSEVALDIARQIQAEVSPQETEVLQQVATRSVDVQAQDAYMRGRYEAAKGTPDALEAAKDFFQTAVDEDSSFAPALAGLAGTRFLLGLADSAVAGDEVARARDEAQRALSLDSLSLEAREVLALIRQHLPSAPRSGVVGGALPRSIPGRTPVVPATPGVDPVAGMDTAWFGALSQLGRQIETRVRGMGGGDARSSSAARYGGARQLMAAGLFGEAVALLSDLVDEVPANAAAWELLARAEVARGDVSAAVGAMEEWAARGAANAPDAASVGTLRDGVEVDGTVGYWRWTLGRLEERRARGERVSPADIAAALAGSGDVEGAFAALGEAVDQRDRGLASLQNEPVWDALRGDPRFVDIARRARTVHLEARIRPQGGPGNR